MRSYECQIPEESAKIRVFWVSIAILSSFFIPQLSRVAGLPTTSTEDWKVVVQIDCTREKPASVIGASQVVPSRIGSYLEGGSRTGDRFVYPFKLFAANRLVRATVTYPDDKMRAAGVSVWGPPQEALGSGYMCGEDVPLSNSMVTRQFIFFCRDQDSALVFSTEAPNQPVALSSLLIEEAVPQLPPAPLPVVSAKNHRRMGLVWEDPVLARCFGEPDSVNPVEFDLVLSRCMEYCKWAGLTEINYPAYWYTAPMFDSRVIRSYPYADRLHPPDSLARIARSCEASGIAYFPVLNVFKLRTLLDHTLDEQQVIDGKPNVNTVGADGRIVTWKNAQYWRDGVSNPLHPFVQDAFKELFVEVAKQCAPYDSFAGVDLAMWAATLSKLGSSAPGDSMMSFDDYAVDGFCADSKLTPPGKIGDKDRFAARAKWLREDPSRWKGWLKWRADRMTEFYNSLATELASIKPGAKLGLCMYTGVGRPENEASGISEQFYASGIDLDALSANPNIMIKRYAQQMLPRWRLRMGMPRPKNLNIENTAEFQKPFVNRPGIGFLLHQQYFEAKPVTADGEVLSLPEPYPSEVLALKANKGQRVTEPLPTGRDYLRFFAYAVKNYDPHSMSVGGYVLGTQGAEGELREMATAFRALPAVKFNNVATVDDVVIRTASAEGKTWVYLVNVSPQSRTVAISVAGGELANAVTGKAIGMQDGKAGIALKPYELISLCGPELVRVTMAENQKQPAR